MSRHRFHIVNVFADSALSGNPLCVFEDGSVIPLRSPSAVDRCLPDAALVAEYATKRPA
jgi:predicted PhzF superfamily epimerase YddE/YHI9